MFRQMMSRTITIILVVLLLVGLFWFGMRTVMPQGTNLRGLWQGVITTVLAGERQVQGPVVVLSQTEDGRSRDLLLLNHIVADGSDADENDNLDTLALTYLSRVDSGWQINWDHKLGQDSTAVPLRVLSQGNAIYLLTDKRLLRLDRFSGEALWEASLRDSVAANCTSCLALVGSRIVVLTSDHYLTGLDASTGMPVWDIRLNRREGPAAGFTQLDELIAIVDYRDRDSSAAALFFFDGRTGFLQQTIIPNCIDPHGTPLAPLRIAEPPYFHEEWQMVDFLLGGGAGYRCLQRWHYPSGRLRLTLMYDRESLPYDPASSQPEPMPARLFRADDLFVGGEGSMIYVHIPTGDKLDFVHEPDYTIYPVQVADGMLLAVAMHNQWSSYELWGIDLPTLSLQWRHETGRRRPPFQPGQSDGHESWAYQVTPQGVAVIDIVGHRVGEAERPFVRVDMLNIHTGGVMQGKMTQVYDPLWTGITWVDNGAYLVLRRLHHVDFSTGEVNWEWPALPDEVE